MSQHLPIIKIKVDDRIRQEFDKEALDELATSISRLGLLHPVVVRQLPIMDAEGRTHQLIAGERRLRATALCHDKRVPIPENSMSPLKEVPWGYIPVQEIHSYGEKAELEMELDENLRRKDLTWQEIATATAALHKLRTDADESWTISKTAEEMENRGHSGHTTTNRNRILLGEHLASRPELSKAASEKDAVKLLSQTLEAELRRALAEQGTTRADEYIAKTIDFDEGMRELEPNSVDVIITDPPYGVNADKFNIASVKERHKYKDDAVSALDKLRRMIDLSPVVCKERAHIYIFHDFAFFWDIAEMLEDAGWTVWRRPLIWHKNTGYAPEPDFGPRRHYECIIYAHRGRKPVIEVGGSDVLSYNSPTERFHAAQKPTALYKELLRRSGTPGETVLDPFCGSGPVFRAARMLHLFAIGFDIEAANIQISMERRGMDE